MGEYTAKHVDEDVQGVDSFLSANVLNLFSLEGRTIVITGGGRGIGLAMGFAVAEAGGNVAIIDSSPEPHPHFEKLQDNYGVKVEIYQSDVTIFDVLKDTFAQIILDFGRIDGLVTAAGVCADQPFIERSPESVARTMNINVLGTYYAGQLAVAQMQLQGEGGSLVFIASIAGYVASDGQTTSDYCASKGAVHSLARELGVELAKDQIRVNTISPGYILTDMTLDLMNRQPNLRKIMTHSPPLQRIGNRSDLKGAVVYLLSAASAYQTSSDILITGGIHAGR
ncbi:hypothetical protein BDV36DRAFT_306086 [Aspergillus pseudocaelatus]|uniref:Ketoreductase domain-containing protein n=1 Tax=Aspergillus pseudocaelatus TaxID=1825620 RepID=A0ABQ6X2K6_9EURO|nr:hypothetical protein BDV36DRAFT_306086 [Aspergillus pseudocaelatus]